jgi:hypothetical protein
MRTYSKQHLLLTDHIKVGDKFLACLVAVDGGLEIENAHLRYKRIHPKKNLK